MAGFRGDTIKIHVKNPNSGGAYAPSRADVEALANETFNNLVRGLRRILHRFPLAFKLRLDELRFKGPQIFKDSRAR